MDLMSLLAKLTLDKTEYDKGLEDAEKSAQGLTIPEVSVPKPKTDEFKKGLDEAEETGNLFQEVMKGVWEGVKDAIVVTGITGILSSIIGYMKQGISLAIKDGKAISDNAKNLEMSTRAYQEYEYILGKSNLQMSDLKTAMSAIDKVKAGKATKDQAEYLEELGLNAEDATFGIDSLVAALADYQGNDKGAIIDAFFGKSDKWTGFFSQTKSEIEGLKQEAEDLGLIMSEKSIENAKEFSDTTEKLHERLEAIQRSFGEGILPVITDAVNKLMMIVDFFTGSDKRTSSEKFTDLDADYEAKIRDINATGRTAEALAGRLIGMGDTSQMDSTQLAVWKGTAASLIEMIPTLSDAIDVENGTINESSEAISELIKQYTNLQKQTAYQTTKAEKQNVLDQKRNQIVEKSIEINDKLSEAEGKRNDAIDAYNKVLQKYGHEDLGYEATAEDITRAQDEILNNLYGDEGAYANAYMELLAARKPVTEAIGAAQMAQTEVEKLTADVEQGQTEFDEWTAKQGEAYGEISQTAQGAVSDVNGVTEALNGIPSDVYSTIHISTEEEGRGMAIGGTIPYDNYPALLHRGEKVLTATEVRKGEGAGYPDYSAMEDRIVAAINKGMENATVRSYLNGKDITDDVNRRNMEDIKGRRYRG